MKKERRLQSRLTWTGEVVQFGRWLGGKISEGKRKAKRREQWRQASKKYRLCKHGQTVRAVSDLRAPRKISGLPPAPALNLNGEL